MKTLIFTICLISLPAQSAELYCTGTLTSTATIKIILADGYIKIIPIKAPEKRK